MKSTVLPNGIVFVIFLITAFPGIVVAEELPTMELLEFLGEWETEEGEWLDPSALTDTELAESEEADYGYTAEEQYDEQ